METCSIQPIKMTETPKPATEKPASGLYGWIMVASAFVVAVLGWGTGFYGPPVYLEIVRQAKGWPISIISLAVTVHFLVGLLVIPSMPRLYRRFGLPNVTLAGGVVMASGIWGWAAATAPWHLFVAAGLSGIGWSVLGAVAVNAIVSPWFTVKRSMALGVAFNGGSVGGVIFTPLWIALIDKFGFIAAATVIGCAMVAILGLLSIFVLRWTPETSIRRADGESSGAAEIGANSREPANARRFEPLRDRNFVTLCLGMTLALFAQTGIVAHLVSVLTPMMGTAKAGAAAGALGVAAVAGRLAAGWRSSARSNWRVIAAYSLLAQAMGCMFLAFADDHNAALAVLGVLLFGLGVGNAISVPPVIANLEFSGSHASRTVALIVAISQGVYAVAPALFGMLRQLFSNQSIFEVAFVVQLLAIAAYLRGGGPLKK